MGSKLSSAQRSKTHQAETTKYYDHAIRLLEYRPSCT
ncbi:unnamed protein product [Ectocarpus sp. CCAP 1310/34]|nr:unnamed protein product [Ectocarpus sp. CCAP 1310/34]